MKSPYKQISDFEESFRRKQLSHGLSHGLSHNCLIIVTCRPYEHLKRLVTAFPQRTRYLGRGTGVPTLLLRTQTFPQKTSWHLVLRVQLLTLAWSHKNFLASA
jgi:hypothetical protein